MNKWGITKDIYNLFKLEAKLAGLNIYPLLLSLVFLIVFVLSLWLSLMFLAGELIFIVTNQLLISIISVLIVNFIAILVLARSLKERLKQMSFARTRDCLKKPQERSERESEKAVIKLDNSSRGEN